MSPSAPFARRLLAILALLATLTGCIDATERGTAAPLATRTEAEATDTAAAPARGGMATIGVVGDLRALNPAFVPDSLAATIFRPVVEGLFERDPEGRPRAWLAESVPTPGKGVSTDGRTVILRLRQGVAWEDGRAFTANDVLFTYAAAQNLDNPFAPEVAAAYRAIRAVDALDPYTVRLTLAEPGDAYLRAFSPIFPAHLFDDRTGLVDHPYARAPFGTGPFRFGEWIPGSSLTLVRSASYRRGDRPYLAAIIFRAFPDRAAADAALGARTIDLLLSTDGQTLAAPANNGGALRGVAPVPNAPPTWNAQEWWRAER